MGLIKKNLMGKMTMGSTSNGRAECSRPICRFGCGGGRVIMRGAAEIVDADFLKVPRASGTRSLVSLTGRLEFHDVQEKDIS